MAAAKKKQEVIELPAITLETIEVAVIGTSPLITHNWDTKALRIMENKHQGKAQFKKPPKDIFHEFLAAFYFDQKGHASVKSTAFKGAAISGCRMVDGLPMTVARGAFHVDGELVNIRGMPHMRRDFARNDGPSRTVDLRYRPCFDEWGAVLQITFNPRAISKSNLVNLVNAAGFSCGIGDWRPGSPKNYSGSHGLFAVSKTAVVMKLPQIKKADLLRSKDTILEVFEETFNSDAA